MAIAIITAAITTSTAVNPRVFLIGSSSSVLALTEPSPRPRLPVPISCLPCHLSSGYRLHSSCQGTSSPPAGSLTGLASPSAPVFRGIEAISLRIQASAHGHLALSCPEIGRSLIHFAPVDQMEPLGGPAGAEDLDAPARLLDREVGRPRGEGDGADRPRANGARATRGARGVGAAAHLRSIAIIDVQGHGRAPIGPPLYRPIHECIDHRPDELR